MRNPWIEAMRLRTLPVSVAGVITAAAMAWLFATPAVLPLLLCLVFALLAQIASNFANEYFDFRAGLDKPGRVGPRRGVTEGDITPGAMKRATFLTLGLACADGLALVPYGGWWLIPAGICIALGALAYSAGPYPLSRHALGEVAVFFFFGIIPVNLTYYVSAGSFSTIVLAVSAAIGLMGANVLIVNNYRDADGDAEAGKKTIANSLGPRVTRILYLVNGLIASALFVPAALASPLMAVPVAAYLPVHLRLCTLLRKRTGASLNPLLGATAKAMLVPAVLSLLVAAVTAAWLNTHGTGCQ